MKKTNRGLDQALSELNIADEDNKRLATIETSGIDNILEVLGVALSDQADIKVDRNATKRVGAAYAAFEARRLQEMKDDGTASAMRLSSRKEQIRKEFATSPENPMRNRLNVKHNATKEEIEEVKQQERERIEALYSSKSSK